MFVGGLVIAAWDIWLYMQVLKVKTAWKNRHNHPAGSEETNANSTAMEPISRGEVERNDIIQSRQTITATGTGTLP